MILFASYLVFCSFYASNLTSEQYTWMDGCNRGFLVSVLIQYLLELVAFGFQRHRRVQLIFETIGCIFIFSYFHYKARFLLLNADQEIRILNGIAIFFQIFRYLKRNSPLT